MQTRKRKIDLFFDLNPHVQNYSKSELQYYKSLSDDRRKQVALYEKETLEEDKRGEMPMRFQILTSGMDGYAKRICLEKIGLHQDCGNSEESTKVLQWVSKLSSVPFGMYKTLPYDSTNSSIEDISSYLKTVREEMNRSVYGHSTSKDQFMRILAQWITNPKSKGNVIGIHGHPGVGKTSLVKDGICRALQLPFGFVPLGGASDASYLVGHDFTYQGSNNGRIVDLLIKCGCMNPVLFFDELDKISNTSHGEEIVNVLIHLTDPVQNSQFHDKYFGDITFDLSKALIIFTYNDESLISPILKDRMITIRAKDYTLEDKINIAKDYILPDMYKEFHIEPDMIELNPNVIKELIQLCGDEYGVRNLKRAIEYIFSSFNLARYDKDSKKKLDANGVFSIIKEYKKNQLLSSRAAMRDSVTHMYM